MSKEGQTKFVIAGVRSKEAEMFQGKIVRPNKKLQKFQSWKSVCLFRL